MSFDMYHYVYYEKSLDHELLLVQDDNLDPDTRFVSFVDFNEVNVSEFKNNLSTIILTNTISIPEIKLNSVIVISPPDKYNGLNTILYENYKNSLTKDK